MSMHDLTLAHVTFALRLPLQVSPASYVDMYDSNGTQVTIPTSAFTTPTMPDIRITVSKLQVLQLIYCWWWWWWWCVVSGPPCKVVACLLPSTGCGQDRVFHVEGPA
jgi:hypothetical protein